MVKLKGVGTLSGRCLRCSRTNSINPVDITPPRSAPRATSRLAPYCKGTKEPTRSHSVIRARTHSWTFARELTLGHSHENLFLVIRAGARAFARGHVAHTSGLLRRWSLA
eukprot:24780-Pyramimonas_sp.AAC.1